MPYYVIVGDNKYGPADLAELAQWAVEGRLNTESILEDTETGAVIYANQIAELQLQPPVVEVPRENYEIPVDQREPTYNIHANPYGVNLVTGNPMDTGHQELTKSYTMAGVGVLLGSICCIFIGLPFGIWAISLANTSEMKGHPGARAAKIVTISLLVLQIGVSIIRAFMMFGRPKFP